MWWTFTTTSAASRSSGARADQGREALEREADAGRDSTSGLEVTHPQRRRPRQGVSSRAFTAFLSHLGILRDALRDGLESVWVLGRRDLLPARREAARRRPRCARRPGTLLLGHSLSGAGRLPRGLVPLVEGSIGRTATRSIAGCSPGSSTTSPRRWPTSRGIRAGGGVTSTAPTNCSGASTPTSSRWSPTRCSRRSGDRRAAWRGLRWYDRGTAAGGSRLIGAWPPRRAVALDGITFGGAAPTDPDALGAALAARKAQKEKSGGLVVSGQRSSTSARVAAKNATET